MDVVIIGAGAAGMGAALYLAREGLDVVVYEKGAMGGVLMQIANLLNYPGWSGSGAELAKKMREQVEGFGAKFEYGEATSVSGDLLRQDLRSSLDVSQNTSHSGAQPFLESHPDTEVAKPLITCIIDGQEVSARAVLVATGNEPKKLELPGVASERISYCATCDGPLYRGKSVLVVGGGNSALQEALHLAEFADKVTVVNRSELKASVELVSQAEKSEKIEILTEIDPVEYAREHQFDGYFAFIGVVPSAEFLGPEVLDKGYVVTDDKYMTGIAGVFAAGSVRAGGVNQVITSVAEGAEAAIHISKWLRAI